MAPKPVGALKRQEKKTPGCERTEIRMHSRAIAWGLVEGRGCHENPRQLDIKPAIRTKVSQAGKKNFLPPASVEMRSQLMNTQRVTTFCPIIAPGSSDAHLSPLLAAAT